MKEQILLIVLLSVLWSCKALKKTPIYNENATIADTYLIATDTLSFPQSWVGDYKGELMIISGSNKKLTYEMELRIGPADLSGHHPWTMIYNNEDVRAYGLIALDKSKGLYLIDEYNSIKLEGYHKGDHFITKFNVSGSDLLVDYEKIGEDIRIRFYVSNDQPVSQTGGEVFEKDTVPYVKAFPIAVFQEAILKKVR